MGVARLGEQKTNGARKLNICTTSMIVSFAKNMVNASNLAFMIAIQRFMHANLSVEHDRLARRCCSDF